MGIDPLFRKCIIAETDALIFQDMLANGQNNPAEGLAEKYSEAGFNKETSVKQNFFDGYVQAHRERIGWLIPKVLKKGPGKMDKMEAVYKAIKAANSPPDSADFKKIAKVVTTPISLLNLGYSIVFNKEKLTDGTVTPGEIMDVIIQSYEITPRQVFEKLYDEIYKGLNLSKTDTFKDLESKLPKK